MGKQYDYVIVGAGSAGCVLARRLSDDPATSVLLLEAGGPTGQWFIKMAAGFMQVGQKPEFFHHFSADGGPERSNDTQKYGRGLGGSSAVNGMWYMRGAPSDYDGWRDLGFSEWGWSDIERNFRWLEDYRDEGAGADRGRDGPLQITKSRLKDPILKPLAQACGELGIPWVEDINATGTVGIGRTQYTVDRRGERVSSWSAFVKPVADRPNLTVVSDVTVDTVLTEDRRAVGVRCASEDADVVEYFARRDVIVCAGVYNSPALLQRSGIGDPALLRRLDIPAVAALPAVGANLRDHKSISVSYDLLNHGGDNREFSGWRLYRHAVQWFLLRSGRMARVGMPLTALYSSTGDSGHPDLQIGAAPFAMRSSKEMKAEPGRGPLTKKPGITFLGFILRPYSLGSVEITSRAPTELPRIRTGWWSDERDRTLAITLVRTLRRLAASAPLKRFVGDERVPGTTVTSDDAVAEELKWMVSPGLHGTGTCKMGTSSEDSVVDTHCRVHGLRGLRVVDASIMPTPVSGNTNGPVMAVAARAAELILADAALGNDRSVPVG